MALTSLLPQEVFLQVPAPHTNALTLANEFPSHKVWAPAEDRFCASPGAGESAHEPFQSHFSVYRSPINLVGVNPVGLQSQMFWNLISLGCQS